MIWEIRLRSNYNFFALVACFFPGGGFLNILGYSITPYLPVHGYTYARAHTQTHTIVSSVTRDIERKKAVLAKGFNSALLLLLFFFFVQLPNKHFNLEIALEVRKGEERKAQAYIVNRSF